MTPNRALKILLVLIFVIKQNLNSQELAFITHLESPKISVIDVNSNSVIKTIDTELLPLSIAWLDDCSKIYVGHFSNILGIYDYDGVDFTLKDLISTPVRGLAIDKENQLWVANVNREIDIYDTATDIVTNSIQLEDLAWAISITSDGQKAIVTSNSESISFINTSTFSFNTLQSTKMHWGCLSNDNSTYIGVNEFTHQIFIYDVNDETLVQSMDVGMSPIGCVWANDDSKIYVANSFDDDVEVINADIPTDTYINTNNNIPLSGMGPIGIDITHDGNFLYLPMSQSDHVSVVNLNTNSEHITIDVEDSPAVLGKFIKPSMTSSSGEFIYENEDIIKVFPNPSYGQIQIEMGQNIGNDIRIDLLNSTGQIIQENIDYKTNKFTLNPGFYYLNVILNQSIIINKPILIFQH